MRSGKTADDGDDEGRVHAMIYGLLHFLVEGNLRYQIPISPCCLLYCLRAGFIVR